MAVLSAAMTARTSRLRSTARLQTPMRSIPNFVLLRAFEAAGRLQSFSLAARELHLTPSAISHQIRELEEIFGRVLFVRAHRRVELTADGRRLLKGLSPVLDALEACCNDLRKAPSNQVLSVYCAPTFAAKWLSPRLPSFARAHPDIGIRLTSSADYIDLNEARDIDVAITYFGALQRPGVEVMALGKERIIPLAAPALIDQRKSWKELIGDLTLIESQLSQVTWRDWFALNALDISEKPRQSFDRAALSISAAVDGLGAALESARLAEREIARGELVELGASTFKSIAREVHHLSQRSHEKNVDKIRRFREWLLQELTASAQQVGAGSPAPASAGAGRARRKRKR